MKKILFSLALTSIFLISCKQRIKPVLEPDYPQEVLNVDTTKLPRFEDKKVNDFLEQYTIYSNKLMYAAKTNDTVMILELGKLKQEWGTKTTAISQRLEKNMEEKALYYSYVDKLLEEQNKVKNPFKR